MNEPKATRSFEKGQTLVLFALFLTALVGFTGLVVDGSGTFVQRRDMQNAADLAAMAGGYGYLNATGPAAAARQVASAHGFTDGVNGASVAVNVAGPSDATTVTVNITAPHQNYFSGVLGFSSWQVSTTATSLAGVPNEVAGGAMPIIFNTAVCASGCPIGLLHSHAYDEPPSGPQSIPLGTSQFNWTVFCLANGNPCNADTSLVAGLINGSSPTTQAVITLTTVIDPLNAGAHTALFNDLAAYVGTDITVAMVDNTGALQGFALFHLTGSSGGSTKEITGYFESGVSAQNLVIGPGGGTPQFTGIWSIRLVN
jgi:Flp pilus assembly protein TadG